MRLDIFGTRFIQSYTMLSTRIMLYFAGKPTEHSISCVMEHLHSKDPEQYELVKSNDVYGVVSHQLKVDSLKPYSFESTGFVYHSGKLIGNYQYRKNWACEKIIIDFLIGIDPNVMSDFQEKNPMFTIKELDNSKVGINIRRNNKI